jgi:type IV secretion system protein VirD4
MSRRQKMIVAALATAGVAGAAIGGQFAGAALFAKIEHLPATVVGIFTLHDYWEAYGDVASVRRALKVCTAVSVVIPLLPIALACAAAMRGPRRELHGSARFAKAHEIRRYGLLKEAEARSSKAGKRSPSILVGKYRGKFLTFPGQQFVTVSAESRSGKGVAIVVPNLLTFTDSVAVLDVKDENFQLTSRYRQWCGQEVYRWAPFDEHGCTHRFNPLHKIAKAPPHLRIGMLQLIAARLYSTADARNKFFYEQARDLFLGLGLYLIETTGDCTFGDVLRSATRPDKKVREHLTEMTQHEVNGQPLSGDCLGALSRVLASPDETMLNIVATFNAGLSLFSNPFADHATSANDFDLSQVRRKLMSVYLVLPVSKLPIAGLLSNLFFNELIESNIDVLPSQDPSIRYQCLVLQDEAAAIGPLPVLSKGVAFIAGYWMRLLTIWQSKSQGEAADMYGREGMRNFLTNHAVMVAFPPREHNDAKELSDTLGTFTMGATSRSRSHGRHSSTGTNTSDHARSLMLAQELKEMPQSEQILLGFQHPIHCDKAFYYNDHFFIDRLKAVSPMLAALGDALPDEDMMKAAQQSGELSARSMPEFDIAAFHAQLSAKAAGEIRLARQAGAKALTAAELVALDRQSPPQLVIDKTLAGLHADLSELGVPMRDDVWQLLAGFDLNAIASSAVTLPADLALAPIDDTLEAEQHG